MVTSPFCFFSIMDKLFFKTSWCSTTSFVFVIFIQKVEGVWSSLDVCVATVFEIVLLSWICARWSWSRISWYRVTFGWNGLTSSTKVFSHLFFRTLIFTYISSIFNKTILCPPFVFLFFEKFHYPIKSHLLNFSCKPKTPCNTAFWTVKMTIHVEKSHARSF